LHRSSRLHEVTAELKPNLKCHETFPVDCLPKTYQSKETISLGYREKGHAIVVLSSTSCESCLPALEALDEYQHLAEFAGINCTLIADGPYDALETIRIAFEPRIQVVEMPVFEIADKLKSTAMPWIYALDQDGTVVSSAPFNTLQQARELCLPVIRKNPEISEIEIT